MPSSDISSPASAYSGTTAVLLRGLSAYGASEMVTRVVRLGATIIIARQLAPEIVGQAALSLTLFELVRVLARNGVGQQIIACRDDDLDATCNTAHRLFWLWSVMLMVLQLLVSLVLWQIFAEPVAGAMLAALSLVYLWMPGGLVQCHLGMREGLTGRMAFTAACQTIADALLTMAMLLIWPSPWSIVLPKLLTAPIWLVMTRRNRPWCPNVAAGRLPVADFAKFSGGVMLAEALFAIRTQCDNLIVAAMMGTSALGTYFFAFNAGIGIVSSLVSAFGTVAFPMLCAAPEGGARNRAMMRISMICAAIFVPLVILQAFAAPFYVPVIFGEHWAPAAMLVSFLCLSGLPLILSTLTTICQRSMGQTGQDARNQAISCAAALSGLACGAATGSLQAATLGLVAGQSFAALFNLTLALLPHFDRISFRTEKFS